MPNELKFSSGIAPLPGSISRNHFRFWLILLRSHDILMKKVPKVGEPLYLEN